MPLIDNVASAQHHATRITQPHVCTGWLDHGPGAPGRGDEPFVPVSWDTASTSYPGNCGESTATTGPKRCTAAPTAGQRGRFHHAQSQVHRFLNCLGGYVRHVNRYSLGTSTVLLPYVIADVTCCRPMPRPSP